MGLLALMLLHDARRTARTAPNGELILLDAQDRRRWNAAAIAEGAGWVERALRSRRFGPYTIQSTIAAVHAQSPSSEATDWSEIVGLYDVLLRLQPSPVIALNRVVALAMQRGPQAGLETIEALLQGGTLADYHLAHAARADMRRRLGRHAVAPIERRRARIARNVTA